MSSLRPLRIHCAHWLALLVLCAVSLPAVAKPPAASGWVQAGAAWTCNNVVTLTVPATLKASLEDGLLSAEAPGFYAGYGLAEDKKSAEALLKKLRKHLKSVGEIKLGKTARITSNPSLHLVAREGQLVIEKVPLYVAIGYFTNKTEYLSFVVFYEASKASKLKPSMVKMMNSVVFK